MNAGGTRCVARASSERIASLYAEFGPVAYRRCLRLLKDREAARDATQQVFLQCEVDLRSSDRKAAIALLYRTATKYSVRLLRQRTDDK